MVSPRKLVQEIIRTGRRLAGRGLVTARAGNLSCRLDERRILITATGSSLGALTAGDIVTVELETGMFRGNRRPSSELPLHSAIYRAFGDGAVVHCHPTLVNAYFCIYPGLKYLTFESRYYLGDVPVVGQKSLTVTDPRPVVRALERNSLVVLRNHGVFCRAASLAAGLERVEILEEAVRVYALARLFGRKKLDALDKELKRHFPRS